MKTILKNISKVKLFLYLLFALLYSLQGLLTSFLIQIAGQINANDTRIILSFGFFGVLLFVFIYFCMYVNNILARSMIKDINVIISQKALQNFYQKKLHYSSSELNSFLAQDIPMFWQEYLTPLIKKLQAIAEAIIFKTGETQNKDGKQFKSKRKNAKLEPDKLCPQNCDEDKKLYSQGTDNTC